MKKMLSKLFAVALAVMLCASMLLSVSAASFSDNCMAADAGDHDLSDFSAKADIGIFALKMSKGTDAKAATAFLVQAGAYKYLLSTADVAGYAEAGYELTLMAVNGASIPCFPVAIQNDKVLYLEAEGLDLFTALEFTSDPIETNLAAGLGYCNEEMTKCLRIEYKGFDFSKWTKISEYEYAYDGLEAAWNWMGAPIFHNSTDYIVQGIASSYKVGSKAMISVISFAEFPLEPTFALGVDRSSLYETNPAETGSSEETTTETTQPGPGPNPGPNTKILIIAAAAAAGIAYYFHNKKQKEEKERKAKAAAEKAAADRAAAAARAAAEQVNDGFTVPVGPKEEERTHGVTRALSNWQLRAVGGPLDGKTFNISGTMKIGRSSGADIRFPDGVGGISGSHCEISVMGDTVTLKDVGSTYGTYVNGKALVPHTEQKLFASDTFNLAKNGPAFRLERVGGMDTQKIGPAVRDVQNRNYQAGASGKLTFGRSAGNIVIITSADKAVSGNHCVLYREGGKLYLKDVGSTNGTFFSEKERLKPNTPYRVRKGQAFFLSSPKYTFVVTEE